LFYGQKIVLNCYLICKQRTTDRNPPVAKTGGKNANKSLKCYPIEVKWVGIRRYRLKLAQK